MNDNIRDRWYNKIELAIMIVTFMGMVIIGAMNVFTRYCLSYTFPWSDQMIRLLFIWVAYSGVSYAGLLDEHLRLTVVSMLFKRKEHVRIFIILGDIVTVIFAVYISYRIFGITTSLVSVGKTFASIPWLSVGFMYGPAIAGCIGLAIRTVQRNVIEIRKEKNDKKEVQ